MNTDHTDKMGIINKMKICVYPCRSVSQKLKKSTPSLEVDSLCCIVEDGSGWKSYIIGNLGSRKDKGGRPSYLQF